MLDPSLADTVVERRLPAPPAGVDVGGLTHPGKVRPTNQDNFHIIQFGRYLRTVGSSLPGEYVAEEADRPGYGLAVADGAGGQAGGEFASRLAITLFVRHVLQTPDWILGEKEHLLPEVMGRATGRFRAVNEGVLKMAREYPILRGMGTTLSLALSMGDDLVVAHVGGSPAFLLRQGQLHRLTRDHTRPQPGGGSDPAAAQIRHVLTRAIGIPVAGGEPDVARYKLADGDRLLLCTDGLTVMADEEAITHELGRAATAAAACQSLVNLALGRGGGDNVTAVVAIYHHTADPPLPAPGR